MNEQTRIACRHTWNLCRGAAFGIYGDTPPTDEYGEAAARLLYMTAAHESGGFRWRRQLGFDPAPQSYGGAFGLWQIEQGSIATTLAWMRRKPSVVAHAQAWLEYIPRYQCIDLGALSAEAVCRSMQEQSGDPLGAVFARCHYMWITPKPIPLKSEDQAAYAKQYWNTAAGAASMSSYLEAFDAYWLPEFGV